MRVAYSRLAGGSDLVTNYYIDLIILQTLREKENLENLGVVINEKSKRD